MKTQYKNIQCINTSYYYDKYDIVYVYCIIILMCNVSTVCIRYVLLCVIFLIFNLLENNCLETKHTKKVMIKQKPKQTNEKQIFETNKRKGNLAEYVRSLH